MLPHLAVALQTFMTILATFTLSVFVLYLLTSLLLWYGVPFSSDKKSQQRAEDLPTVSILIAARDEEERLPTCLTSLLHADYPPEKIEIIVINDRSTDRTLQIAEAFAQRDARVRAISLTQRLPGMSGKASTLCQGMSRARGEIILITDADCIVPPTWVSAMVESFTAEVGLVGGFTLLSPSNALRKLVPQSHRDHLFAKVQTLDWMYLLTVGAGAAGLGKPVSILGNNFGFRRAAYEQVSGYEKIAFSIIEDFALMQKIAHETEWRVHFPLDPDTTIFSFPTQTWREYFEQRRRWAAGGKEVGLFAKFLMIVAFVAHLATPLALFFSSSVALVGLVAILLADVLLLWRCAVALRCTSFLKYFPLFEIYFFAYSLTLAATVLFPATVHWKGVRYRWNMWGKVKSVEE